MSKPHTCINTTIDVNSPPVATIDVSAPVPRCEACVEAGLPFAIACPRCESADAAIRSVLRALHNAGGDEQTRDERDIGARVAEAIAAARATGEAEAIEDDDRAADRARRLEEVRARRPGEHPRDAARAAADQVDDARGRLDPRDRRRRPDGAARGRVSHPRSGGDGSRSRRARSRRYAVRRGAVGR